MKKYILLLGTAIVLSLIAPAQVSYKQSLSNWCGTTLPPEVNAWRMQNHQNPDRPTHKQGVVYNIPIKFHIVGKSDGTGYYKRSDLLNILCDLNDQFVPAGFRFYIAGNTQYITKDADLHFIPSDYFYSYDAQSNVGSELFQNFNGSSLNVYNAYIVGNATGLCGRSRMSPNKGGIELVQGCLFSGNTTFAHESGHWFSLPHTFDGWESWYCTAGNCDPDNNCSCNPSTYNCFPSNVENVARTGANVNCTTKGDGYCDTEADYYFFRWGGGSTCPNECPAWKDPKGVTLAPDESLFMSYANDACTSRFSPEQMNDMIAYLQASRSYLLTPPAPEKDTITAKPTLLAPAANGDTIPSDYYVLRWSAVPNATMYHIMVSRSSGFSSLIKADIFTPDTFYIVTTANNLDLNVKHYWKVKGFNPGYTCAPYSTTGNFIAGKATGLFPNDGVINNITLYPNPLSENQFHLEVNAEQNYEAKALLYNIEGRLITETDLAFQAGKNDKTITLPGYMPEGVYLFHLISEKERYVQKLMVVR